MASHASNEYCSCRPCGVVVVPLGHWRERKAIEEMPAGKPVQDPLHCWPGKDNHSLGIDVTQAGFPRGGGRVTHTFVGEKECADGGGRT